VEDKKPEQSPQETITDALIKAATAQASVNIPKPLPGVGRPAWAKIPEGLVLPQKPIYFIRFPSEWTDLPIKGDVYENRLYRQCIIWTLLDGEERVAMEKTMVSGTASSANTHLAMRMIRAVDGHKADWSGERDQPGSVEQYWTELGSKCRKMMIDLYQKMHLLDGEDRVDFFENCVAAWVGG
jgi:hypothetical protein